MADSMTFKELRSLPPVHLELAIEHLENSEKKPGITTDAKASLANTILAVKSFLEVRRLRVMMLQTNAGSTESLSRMYYQMSKEELMEAYNHHIAMQRKTFHDYIDSVMYQSDCVKAEGKANGYGPGDEWRCLDAALPAVGLPSLKEVFESIEQVVLKTPGARDGATTTLIEVLQNYNA